MVCIVFLKVAIALTPLIPIVSSILIPLLRLFTRRKVLFNIILLSTVFIDTILVFYTSYHVYFQDSIIVYCFSNWFPPIGICYVVDKLSIFMSTILVTIYSIVSIYTIWYSRHIPNYYFFYTVLLIHLGGILGLFYTSDLFNIYVMIEVIGLSAYSLVSFYHNKLRSLIASTRYALLGAFYTTLFLLAVMFIHISLGTLNIADLSIKLGFGENYIGSCFLENTTTLNNGYVLMALVLIIWTTLFLSAVFPNHFWLPSAHSEAPSPASALLSGVTVGVGVYVIIRLLYLLMHSSVLDIIVEGLVNTLMILSVISIFYGALMMSVEDDVKRILAYSTILNIGYVFMGLSLGTPYGVSASLLHFLNHSIGKASAFLSIGVFIRNYRSRNIHVLEGVGRENVLLTSFLTISLLHLIGIPPTIGFYSKLLLFQAFINSRAYGLALVVVLGTAASAYGYVRLIEHLWHPPIHGVLYRVEKIHLSTPVLVSLLILTTIMFTLGLSYQWISHYMESTGFYATDPIMYIDSLCSVFRELHP